MADLIELVERDERLAVLRLRNAGAFENGGERAPVIEPDRELLERERRHHIAHRREDLRLDDERGRADGVDVALIELAKASARGPVGAPYRLNLIALEEARQLVLILRDDARERDGEVVPEREIGLARSLVLSAAQNLENELAPLLAVLPGERLDVLERGRLERLESVPLVHLADDVDDVLTASDLVGEKVACAAWRFS